MKDSKIRDYLKEAGVPEVMWESAVANIQSNLKLQNSLGYKWKAPFATIKLLRGLAWEADQLAEKDEIYGNEFSLNGDHGGWTWSREAMLRHLDANPTYFVWNFRTEKFEEQPVTQELRDWCAQVVESPENGTMQPATLGDRYYHMVTAMDFPERQKQGLPYAPAIIAADPAELVYWGWDWVKAIYQKFGGKINARNNFMRWMWIGLRNRASKAYFNAGPAYDPDFEEWGPMVTHGVAGVRVCRMGNNWQIMSYRKHPLQIWTRVNLGCKVANAHNHGVARAMLVNIPWSLRIGKGKTSGSSDGE